MPRLPLKEGAPMLKYYVKATEALKRLRTDKDGVVSLEYVIVGACVCAVVLVLFNGTGTNTLSGALTTGFGAIASTMTGLP
jgi:pilus assembly protein Flp/PilA